MQNQAPTVPQLVNGIIVVTMAAAALIGLLILTMKAIFRELTSEKAEPRFNAGDICQYCFQGILKRAHIKADPSKVQVQKHFLLCRRCWRVYSEV